MDVVRLRALQTHYYDGAFRAPGSEYDADVDHVGYLEQLQVAERLSPPVDVAPPDPESSPDPASPKGKPILRRKP